VFSRSVVSSARAKFARPSDVEKDGVAALPPEGLAPFIPLSARLLGQRTEPAHFPEFEARAAWRRQCPWRSRK
ncbi:MAG: hypothetical protein ACREH4_01950, partial [Vitreimonas sp.]